MREALRSETVERLRARISTMQATTLGARTLPTDPAIAAVLPGGALRAGSSYGVPDSLALAMLLLAGPSAAGGWCAVIGVPEFGVEAAAAFGIALDRLVLIPEPGEQWLAVTAQVAEVVPVVMVRPPTSGASAGETARLASRLRQRGSTLVVAGPWSGAEAVLTIEGGTWVGVGTGSGYLAGRVVTVRVVARDAVTRHEVRIEDHRAAGPASPTRLAHGSVRTGTTG